MNIVLPKNQYVWPRFYPVGWLRISISPEKTSLITNIDLLWMHPRSGKFPPSWWHQPFPAFVSTHPTGPIFRLLSQISHDGRFFPAHREQISFGSKQKPIKPPQKQLVAPAVKKIWHAGVPLFFYSHQLPPH